MAYSESDIRAIYIDPALKKSKWKPDNICREHYVKHEIKKFRGYADYLLRLKDIPLAVIEAKREEKNVKEGLNKAIIYATLLGVNYVYSSNGKEIYELDINTGVGCFIDSFPTPANLIARIKSEQTSLKELFQKTDYHLNNNMPPHWFQAAAIQQVVDAIAKWEKRISFIMATGSGKSHVIFQIIHKLIQNGWNIEGEKRKPRILLITSRSMLVEQYKHTLQPYIEDIIVNTWQMLLSVNNNRKNYRKYKKRFFDLIIVDEYNFCSIENNSHEILNFFNSAICLGLSSFNSDTTFFNAPVYEFTYGQAIEEGILLQGIVKKINIGQESRNDISTPKAISDTAKAIIGEIEPADKIIIYCKNKSHAIQLCDEINNRISINSKRRFCKTIISKQGLEAQQILHSFKHEEEPRILTSVNMLTTGLDMPALSKVVICRHISNKTEILKILGNVSRRYRNKEAFTIMDFTDSVPDNIFSNL